MKMTRKRGRRIFERNERVYRAFLTKFTEKPSFDNMSITVALEYAYRMSYRMNGSLQMNTIIRLIEVILANEKKIRNDLETLKISPESIIEPIAPDDSLNRFERVTHKVIKNYTGSKRHREEDLTNIICKKLKLSNIPENKDVNSTIGRLRDKYLQQKKDNKKRRIIDNANMLKFVNIEKKKSLPVLEETRIPVVVLERDKRLLDMVKKFSTQKKDEDKENEEPQEETDDEQETGNEKEVDNEKATANQKKEIGKEKETNNEKSIENEKETNNESLHEKSVEKELEKINEEELQKNSSCVIVQNNPNQIENENDNIIQPNGHLYLKEEVDLFDVPSQLDISQPPLDTFESHNEYEENDNETAHIPQAEINYEFSQVVENSSMPTMLMNDQETVSSLKVAYYNNLIPSVPLFNNASSIQNTSFMLNMNSSAYVVVPVAQFSPNVIVMNSSGFNSYQGMYSPIQPYNPIFQNAMFTSQQLGMVPEQHHCINQIFNPVQEIAKLQTAIVSLNSQLSSLGNVIATQTHSPT